MPICFRKFNLKFISMLLCAITRKTVFSSLLLQPIHCNIQHPHPLYLRGYALAAYTTTQVTPSPIRTETKETLSRHQTHHCPTQTPGRCGTGGISTSPMRKTECNQTTAWCCPALCAFRIQQCPSCALPHARPTRDPQRPPQGSLHTWGAEEGASPHPAPHLLPPLRENNNAHARRRLHWSRVTCSHAARA